MCSNSHELCQYVPPTYALDVSMFDLWSKCDFSEFSFSTNARLMSMKLSSELLTKFYSHSRYVPNHWFGEPLMSIKLYSSTISLSII